MLSIWTSIHFNKIFENKVRKGENPSNQYFLLFLQCFLPYQRYLGFSSVNALNLDKSIILSHDTEFKQVQVESVYLHHVNTMTVLIRYTRSSHITITLSQTLCKNV